MANINWNNTESFSSQSYQCSHCGKELASEKGYTAKRQEPHLIRAETEYICLCHFCKKPTYIDMEKNQYPGVAFGNTIEGIDDEYVSILYEEARTCISV